jgi:Family of unknown function (DUF6111)
MLRVILEGAFLFLLPFVGFGLWLLLQRQNPLEPGVWSRKAMSWLTIAAIGICIIGVVVVGARREVQDGAFVPSHVDKDGRFVPGGFRQLP